ncbi:hypothetical protein ACWJIK_09480 [Corynebacterium minutissimum]
MTAQTDPFGRRSNPPHLAPRPFWALDEDSPTTAAPLHVTTADIDTSGCKRQTVLPPIVAIAS